MFHRRSGSAMQKNTISEKHDREWFFGSLCLHIRSMSSEEFQCQVEEIVTQFTCVEG